MLVVKIGGKEPVIAHEYSGSCHPGSGAACECIYPTDSDTVDTNVLGRLDTAPARPPSICECDLTVK